MVAAYTNLCVIGTGHHCRWAATAHPRSTQHKPWRSPHPRPPCTSRSLRALRSRVPMDDRPYRAQPTTCPNSNSASARWSERVMLVRTARWRWAKCESVMSFGSCLLVLRDSPSPSRWIHFGRSWLVYCSSGVVDLGTFIWMGVGGNCVCVRPLVRLCLCYSGRVPLRLGADCIPLCRGCSAHDAANRRAGPALIQPKRD
jgi:hypothetical protein